MNYEINNFIGIPFKLNQKSFSGCDCRGIVWLYYKYVKNIELPFSDGKRIFFRDKKQDTKRIYDVLSPIATRVYFNDIAEGDIVVLKSQKRIGALGVCINKYQILHMDKYIGSCITKIAYLKDLFLMAYRLK